MLKSKLAAVFYTALLLSFTGQLQAADQSSATPEHKEVTVSGHVTNIVGTALAGVTVEWGSVNKPFRFRQRTTTDVEGKYTMTVKSLKRHNQFPGSRFAASLPGYSTQSVYRALGKDQSPCDFTLKSVFTAGQVATGIVKDEQGKPIAGVRVEAFTPMVGADSSISMRTGRDYFPGPDRVDITDKQGRFRIADFPKLDPRFGPSEVQLSLRCKHRHVNDANYPLGEEVEITMRGSGKPGVLQGRLVDATTGLPLKDIKELRVMRRHQAQTHRFNSPEGKFQLPFEATLGRRYFAYVYAPGYAATAVKMIAVAKDSHDFTDIPMKKQPTLRGRLLDADTDKPIADAALLYGIGTKASYFGWSNFARYTDGYHGYNFVQHEVTNETGEFWFAEPAEKNGTIIVWVDGYQRLMLKPESRTYDEATGDLVIRVKPESAFTGIVTKEGKPLANIPISVGLKSQDNFHHMFESVLTDSQGRYKYGRLLPGTYFVGGGDLSHVATVGEAETVSLDLTGKLGPLRIHGNAKPSISITIRPDFDWEYSRFSTTADATGKYEFEGLRPGKYRVALHYARSGFGRRDKREIHVKRDGQQIDFPPKKSRVRAIHPIKEKESRKKDAEK